MALGNNNQNSGTLYFLSIREKNKEKEKVAPHFVISARNADSGKFEAKEETVNRVSGDLTKVEVKDAEFEGKPYKKVLLSFVDRKLKETYIVDARINMLTCNLYNNLFNLTSFGDLEVALYRNKKGFSAATLTQKGEKVGWKFEAADIPKVKKVKVGKKEVIDSDEHDEFFLTELEDLANRVKAAKEKSKDEEPAADDSADDVPDLSNPEVDGEDELF